MSNGLITSKGKLRRSMIEILSTSGVQMSKRGTDIENWCGTDVQKYNRCHDGTDIEKWYRFRKVEQMSKDVQISKSGTDVEKWYNTDVENWYRFRRLVQISKSGTDVKK